ncbi:MAG: carbohydrate ABC transporter permease, partial [Chloroflexales bacterium]|nr:carbohydrate ABC transporter permease [Chloroflexales bacterium]
MTTLNPPQSAVAPRPARRRPLSFYLGWGLLYVVLVVGALLFALPLVWMLSSSVKPGYQVYAMPPQWIPDTFVWDGYIEPWKKFAMGTFYRNTLILVIANTVLTLLSSSLVAFAFARMRFRGRNVLFLLVLSTLMLPP